MKYTKIPENTFKEIQLNAGVLLEDFTPSTATVGTIIGATSGGVTFSAKPSFIDFGDDIDNCPKNMLELKKLDTWEVNMSGTFVSVSAELAKLLVAAGDATKTGDVTKIVPRNDILTTDFKDIWWVGDYSDKNGDTNGGFIAIHLINALSTGGFQIKSGDKAKGQFSFEFVGHYSMADQDKVPFEIYVMSGSDEPTPTPGPNTENT